MGGEREIDDDDEGEEVGKRLILLKKLLITPLKLGEIEERERRKRE